MSKLFTSKLEFPCGKIMNNRFMLAPMTNTQSNEDGTLSETEFRWLTMRAKGGFGLVMTCASHVSANGKGFSGQLGIYSDIHIEGHKRLASKIKEYGSLAVVQLYHGGMRSPAELIGQTPLCPSQNDEHSARGMAIEEVNRLKLDFIEAAIRAKTSGYDGVEIHGAHGYILTQFLSSKINKRTDEYGGSLENRCRLLFEIVNRTREVCGQNFLLGVRLSPERFGMDINEVKSICKRFINEGNIDFLDISLWDVFKMPEEENYRDKPLIQHFTELDFKNVKLTVAGKIRSGNDVANTLNSGVDFATIGQAAILHHDFPKKVIDNIDFKAISTPVSSAYLKKEGLGEKFINYMRGRKGFVEDD